MQFFIALQNVGVALLYLVPGFLLRKFHKASEEHLPTLSAILIYIGTPALIVSAFMDLEFSVTDVVNMGLLFVATFILQVLFILIVFLVCRRKRTDPRVRVTAVGSVMGNVGFFGMPIMRALFPDNPEISCYVAVFMVTMNILAFTVGAFCLTGEKRFVSVKSAFFNPTLIGFVIAVPIYLFGLRTYIPSALAGAVTTVSSFTMPLCMFVLGIRLASKPLRTIFSKPVVYLITAAKLLIFPLFSYGIVSLFPLPYTFRAAILILFGTPCAAVLLSLAEMHRGETELAADSILVSTVCCVATIPLLTLLL